MNNIEQLIFVDEITDNISYEIGILTRKGVLSFGEGIEIIKTITDKQADWVKKNTTHETYTEFTSGKYGGC